MSTATSGNKRTKKQEEQAANVLADKQVVAPAEGSTDVPVPNKQDVVVFDLNIMNEILAVVNDISVKGEDAVKLGAVITQLRTKGKVQQV